MARTRYAPDRGLIARMGVTMFLIGLVFTAFIIAIVLLLSQYSNVSNGGIVFIAVLLAAGISFCSLYLSRKKPMSTAGAPLVGPPDRALAGGPPRGGHRGCAAADRTR